MGNSSLAQACRREKRRLLVQRERLATEISERQTERGLLVRKLAAVQLLLTPPNPLSEE